MTSKPRKPSSKAESIVGCIGIGLICVGIAAIYWPAAVIAAGVLLYVDATILRS